MTDNIKLSCERCAHLKAPAYVGQPCATLGRIEKKPVNGGHRVLVAAANRGRALPGMWPAGSARLFSGAGRDGPPGHPSPTSASRA